MGQIYLWRPLPAITRQCISSSFTFWQWSRLYGIFPMTDWLSVCLSVFYSASGSYQKCLQDTNCIKRKLFVLIKLVWVICSQGFLLSLGFPLNCILLFLTVEIMWKESLLLSYPSTLDFLYSVWWTHHYTILYTQGSKWAISRLAETSYSIVAGGVMAGRPRPPSGSKGRALGGGTRGPGGRTPRKLWHFLSLSALNLVHRVTKFEGPWKPKSESRISPVWNLSPESKPF